MSFTLRYILLVAPSVCELDNLFKSCERELNLLDMAINYKKSVCLRIGPRMCLVPLYHLLQALLFHRLKR